MKAKKYYSFLSKRLMSIYVIYITLFTIVAYSLCLVYVRNDFRRTEKEYLENISDSIALHLSYATDTTSVLGKNTSVINFSTDGQDVDYINMIKVSEVIRQTNIVNNSGSEFAVVNLNADTVITAGGSMSLTYYEEMLGIKNKELRNKIEKVFGYKKNTSETMTSYSSLYNKSHLISIISSQTPGDDPAIFIVVYHLDTLFKNIPNNHLPQKLNIVLDKSNISITYTTDSTPSVYFDTFEKGFGYNMVAQHRKNTGFWGNISTSVYVSTLHYLVFINNFFIILLLFIIAMGFIGHLYIKNNAKKLYSPISKMLRRLPTDITDQDDELEGVGNYFNSLESQKNAMSEIISENKIQLRDRFITQLMTSTLTREQIKSELVTYNLEGTIYPGITCIINYKNFDELKNIITMDGIGEVRDAIKEFFSKYFAEENYFKIVELDLQTFAAIICSDNVDNLENMLKKCVLNIEMMLDINLVVFMGSKADSWYDIPASYAEAVTLKNRSRIISDRCIVVSTENIADENTIVYTTEQETELINYVLAENTNMVSACLEKIIDSNLSDNFLPHEYFSQFVTMLYSTIIKLLTSIQKTEKEIFAPVSVYLELMNCTNPTALKSTAMNLFGIIIADIANMRESTSDNSTQYVVNYINKHFAENISLYTLAEYLNMSQSHASKTFKQATGENFKDYLTNLRLSKAVEIMDANPYVKLSDVAKTVGYSSETFTKAFTKKYKMTPSAYMQRKSN